MKKPTEVKSQNSITHAFPLNVWLILIVTFLIIWTIHIIYALIFKTSEDLEKLENSNNLRASENLQNLQNSRILRGLKIARHSIISETSMSSGNVQPLENVKPLKKSKVYKKVFFKESGKSFMVDTLLNLWHSWGDFSNCFLQIFDRLFHFNHPEHYLSSTLSTCWRW